MVHISFQSASTQEVVAMLFDTQKPRNIKINVCVSTNINWNMCDVLLTPQQILVFDGKPGQVPGEFHIIHKLPPRDPVPLHIHIFVAGNADIRRKVWRRHPSQKSFRHFSTVLPHSFSGDTNFSFLMQKSENIGERERQKTPFLISLTQTQSQ